MRTFTAQDMQSSADTLVNSAMAEPVIIVNNNRPSLVLMSMQEFDRLRARRRIVGASGDLPGGFLDPIVALADVQDDPASAHNGVADGSHS
jgi:prevent-host-death family protein